MEQFLLILVGLADTVVVSQYIGRKDMEMASRSASQLLMAATVLAVVISIPILIWKVPLLSFLFGKVETDVMAACRTYLRISVYSFPALGIYNAGTALYRSIGKISVIAMFGTYQIAANGIAQSIWNVAALISSSMGPVFITVIGQCMGANDTDQAEYYFRKLLKITVGISIIWNGLVFVLTPFIIKIFAISQQTGQMVLYLVLIHNIANAVVFPFADPLGKGLRAAGDAMFTMGISLFTTIGVRLIFSVLLGIVLNLGVIGE